MAHRVSIEVDGRRIEAQAGDNLLGICRNNGIDIPGLCYHPRLSVTGGCRLCVVKVDGRHGMVPACTLEVEQGMSIVAFDDELETARRFLIDLLLSEHNCDCLVCESAGACELQDLAYRYGLDSRARMFGTRDRVLPLEETSPVLTYDPSMHQGVRRDSGEDRLELCLSRFGDTCRCWAGRLGLLGVRRLWRMRAAVPNRRPP